MPIDGLQGGTFEGCVLEMTGKVDDPEAFCAARIEELTGKHPSQESQRATERIKLTDIEPGKGPYPGAIWNVTLIGPDPERENSIIEIEGQEYILSENGLPYSTRSLRDEGHKFENCQVYDNHLTKQEFDERGGMRSFGDELTGLLVGIKWQAGERKLKGQYRVGDRSYAQKLADFHELGILAQSAGLSIDTFPTYADKRFEGKRLKVADGFEEVNSTDVVVHPAAGGSLDRRIAAKQTQEVKMTGFTDEQMETLGGLIKAGVAEALAAPSDAEQVDEEGEVTPEEVGDVVIEEVEAIIDAATDPVEAAEEIVAVVEEIAEEVVEVVAEEEEEEPAAAESAELDALTKKVRKMEAREAIRESDRLLGVALDAAKLSNHRGIVETAFQGRMWAKGDLMKTIKRVKEAQTASDPTGQVRGAGGGRLLNTRGSMAPIDQATIGLLQMMAESGAIKGVGNLRAVEQMGFDYVQSRVPEAMRAWGNSGRDNYRPWDGKMSTWLQQFCGYNPLLMRAKEANDVSSITKNAVNLFLAVSYSAREEWWAPIVSTVTVDTLDQSTLIRTYGLSNLAQVSKGDPYVDLTLSDDEETATFQKYGNTISVPLEDMLNDKLGILTLARISQQLSDSWHNTKSALASAVFTVNTATGPVLSDNGALFNDTAVGTPGGHANLLTTALSFTSYGAARVAMRKQTTKKLGAGRRLLATPKFLLIPVDLETTAEQIRDSELQTKTADNDINPHKGKFEIVVVPDWTDASDWATVADPVQFPAIYDIRVRGFEVPQIFTAGDESSGAVFTNDTWKYKARLMTFVFSSTYECLPVADSRGVHKNNV